jgi:hypothetical protein
MAISCLWTYADRSAAAFVSSSACWIEDEPREGIE